MRDGIQKKNVKKWLGYKKLVVCRASLKEMESTKRFSNRVENYVKYRPSYPKLAIDCLFENGINSDSVICDIGSGTGILSKLLLDKVQTIYGVEPNSEMRNYAQQDLLFCKKFESISATAENTCLKNESIDAITVAQAFHWFDQIKCKKEFKRILKPKGKIFLIWNNRINNSMFLKEYDDFLYKYATDYSIVNHQNLTDEQFKIFFNGIFEKKNFDNHQDFNLEGFFGRVFSSSYTPSENDPTYQSFLEGLKRLYEKHNEDGIVRFNYQTQVLFGDLM